MSADVQYCPHCGTEVKPEHWFCVGCGKGLDGKSPGGQEPTRAVGQRVTPETPEHTRKRRRNNWIAVGAIVAVVVCCPLAIIGNQDRPGAAVATAAGNVRAVTPGATARFVTKVVTPRPGTVAAGATRQVITVVVTSAPTATGTNTPAPTATLTPIPTAPPYETICRNVGNMTEAQWKPYLKSLDGHQVVDWVGWVVDVDAEWGGGYEAWIDMDSPDTMFSAQDVYFPVADTTAMALRKGQKVSFSGRIKSAWEFLGSVSVRLEDVTLVYR